MKPRLPCSRPTARGAAAVLLALLVAAVVDARPRAARAAAAPPVTVRALPGLPAGAHPVAAQPKKESDKKESDKKESDKKEPEYKWPTDINGKDINAWMKDMEDADPVNREFAARTLSAFGPPAQKGAVSKLLLKRMNVERDPGVKLAVFAAVGQIAFDSEADNKEALRLLAIVVDTGAPGGAGRLHAIQTIAAFGPKGEGGITALTGTAVNDPAYETRKNIATALGRVGFNESTGPNMRALTALADRLSRDESAAVRMEALQSLMNLGPPWAEVKKAGDKARPPLEMKSVEVIIRYMKYRVGDPKAKPPVPGLERDKQVEIWARLVLMSFDPKEVNDDNLNAFARYLTGAEPGVKVQALNAMGICGELAAKKLNDVVRVLEEKNARLDQTVACLKVLAAIGAGAKPALPNLQKMLAEKKKELNDKALELAKKKDDPQLTGEKYTLDELVKLIEAVIKHVDAAKPTISPSETPKKP